MSRLSDAYDRIKKTFTAPFTQAEDEEAGVDIDDDLPDDELIALWQEMFKLDLEADRNDREEAQRDNEFVNAGDVNKEQWEPQMKAERIKWSRPVLQTNLTTTFVDQIVNEGSRNEPAIGITPSDEGTDATAQFFQGRIRQVEYESNAQTEWDRARQQQITTSRGTMRVLTEPIPGQDPGERQRLVEKVIPNQFSVVWDRGANEYTCDDADHVWIVSAVTPAEHTRLYGKRTTLDSMPFTQAQNEAPDWVGVGGTVGSKGKMIQVAELIKKRFKWQIEIDKDVWEWEDRLPAREFVPLEGKRRKELYCIAVYLFNGVEILPPPAGPPPDEPEARYSKWITNEIPVVPLWGPEAIVNGEKRRRSLIRPAKDAQRMVNFCDSGIAEFIGQAPKTPYWVEFGSIPKDHEQYLAEINQIPRAFMYWISGRMVAGVWREYQKPSREVSEPPIQALSIARQQAIEAMKQAMGIFDAARGERSNETSGIAIERRQQQSGIVNYHFPRNENRSRKRVGEILISAIKVLDQPGREYVIREADGSTRKVPVGKTYFDTKAQKEVTIDFKGNYTLIVNTTVNFESGRKEERAFLIEAVKANPELFWIVGDQIFYLSDVPGSKEMGDRVRRMIDMRTPGLIPPKDGEGQQIPPEVQQVMQAMERELAEAKGMAAEQQQTIETDAVKQQAETQRKNDQIEFERFKLIEELKFKREELAAKESLELGKLGVMESIAELRAMIEVLEGQAGIQREVDAEEAQIVEVEATREHELLLAEGDREHESSEADANRQAASESQEADQDLQREMAEQSESE